MGKSKSKETTQKTESKTETNPWGPAQDQLKDILNEARDQYDRTGGLDGNWVDKNYPDLTDEMKAALQNMSNSGQLGNVADQINGITEGAKGNVDSASNAFNNLQKGISFEDIDNLSSQLYDSETVNNQVGRLTEDINKNYDSQVNKLNQGATSSGNMGSSRAGVAQGVMAGEANKAIATGTADIQNNARNQSINQAMQQLAQNQNTSLNAAQGQGQLGMQQGGLQSGLGGLYQQMMENKFGAANIGQQQEQNKAMNDYFNQFGQSQAGWDNINKYLNIIGGIGSMGGTSNSTGKQTSPGSGGGGMFNNILGGASAGAGIIGSGAQAGWWSDASMKKNVKKTGETKDGTSTYQWDWNESGKKRGMSGSGSGVLAQDVMKDKPEAVGKSKDGALFVDYNKLDVKPKNSKRKKKK